MSAEQHRTQVGRGRVRGGIHQCELDVGIGLCRSLDRIGHSAAQRDHDGALGVHQRLQYPRIVGGRISGHRVGLDTEFALRTIQPADRLLGGAAVGRAAGVGDQACLVAARGRIIGFGDVGSGGHRRLSAPGESECQQPGGERHPSLRHGSTA
ncbi:hypothetical protein SDC9_182581 [bioreactor metagenome]|uniref:Uncharacterized protein n=1 Tax=bioreactor metagenome TaxID=1076179 RepID=A0A645H997_9ZZZZ